MLPGVLLYLISETRCSDNLQTSPVLIANTAEELKLNSLVKKHIYTL